MESRVQEIERNLQLHLKTIGLNLNALRILNDSVEKDRKNLEVQKKKIKLQKKKLEIYKNKIKAVEKKLNVYNYYFAGIIVIITIILGWSLLF